MLSAMVFMIRLLLGYLLISSAFHLIHSLTHPGDASVLQSLKQQWMNTPASWNTSNDPCGAPWEGVSCNNSRVIKLKVSSAGLTGVLGDEIWQLSQLTYLDLSFNPGLQGPLSPQIGNLINLGTLILEGCSFIGSLPVELGNLEELTFLSLSFNNFSGQIPPSLGNLSKLEWLELSSNQLTGPIPVSTSNLPGLDLLKSAKHWRFNQNNLSGIIPEQLFSSDMVLSEILFSQNQLTGEIPSTLGLVQTLQFIHLGHNSLVGNVPSNINNLTNLLGLKLLNNKLSGPLPDLTGLISLLQLDLSSNTFAESEVPDWITNLPSLAVLVINNGPLNGLIPKNLFSLPNFLDVSLRNNSLSGTLDTGDNINQQLEFVDLTDNNISSVALDSQFKRNVLVLAGNPVCSSSLKNMTFCHPFVPSGN